MISNQILIIFFELITIFFWAIGFFAIFFGKIVNIYDENSNFKYAWLIIRIPLKNKNLSKLFKK